MTSTKYFWFLLLDSATGQPYKGTTADFVSLSPGAVVAEFRDAVLSKNPNKLAGVDASDLLVYKNKAAFDARNLTAVDEGKEEPLKASSNLDGLGETEEGALIVAVPSLSSSSPSQSTKRRQRWTKLNEILEGNAKKSKTNDSTAYSYLTWNQVEPIFHPTNNIQPQRAMDDVQLEFLAKYLSFATKSFGSISSGKEAKRLHFIAPILVCVCTLFEGDVIIAVEEDLPGKFIKAHGRFEFMIRRGGKAVCIIEAKKDDIDQGMAQDLVGCEVAAELGGLDVVYGIVTNYVQWNFFCLRDDKVEMEECSICITPEGPEKQSLKRIAEKIYSMLSD